MPRTLFFVLRQVGFVGLAVIAYFRVRGLTEDAVAKADQHAGQILDLERVLAIDFELGLQNLIVGSDLLTNLVNWVYIWGHWPVVAATLVWLAVTRREGYFELRNAMFISGAIGLVIFATYAVTPPRLFAGSYVDTVSLRSVSYRVLQPPGLVNKYAAVPSLHFGWNLLVGYAWYRAGTGSLSRVAAVAMPVAMGIAVVATANHWTFDVVAGAVVAGAGLWLERLRRRWWPVVENHLRSLLGREAPDHGPPDQKDHQPTLAATTRVTTRPRSPDSPRHSRSPVQPRR